MAVNTISSLLQPVKTLSKHTARTLQHHCKLKTSARKCLFSTSAWNPQDACPLEQVPTPPKESLFGDSGPADVQFKGLETSFPCVSRIKSTGPEPEYDKVTKGYKLFTTNNAFPMKLNKGVLPKLDIAYETWGTLNNDKSNAVLVLAGLSASSHARSSVDNMKPGWWERFIGPGCAVDTSKFFVICPNNLGGCYGSSGPSSVNVLTGKPYGTTFPIIGIEDMTNAIFLLLDHLEIDKLHGSVGSSLGGMLSLQSAVSYPERVGRLLGVLNHPFQAKWGSVPCILVMASYPGHCHPPSSCGRFGLGSKLSSALKEHPKPVKHLTNIFYKQLTEERLITISSCAQSHPSSIAMRYLQRKCIMSDPNWNNGHYYGKAYPKIGMKLAREIATITYRSGPEWDERFGRGRISDEPPSLCPTFLIEAYLEHQGESFSTKYDPNSLLYMSKAMDMFDIAEGYNSLEEGLSRVKCPVMVIGVQTDVLFPIWQQRELASLLQRAGNPQVTFYELNSLYGHDTFLLDLNGVGAAIKGFLETEQRESGLVSQNKRRNKERKLF